MARLYSASTSQRTQISLQFRQLCVGPGMADEPLTHGLQIDAQRRDSNEVIDEERFLPDAVGETQADLQVLESLRRPAGFQFGRRARRA